MVGLNGKPGNVQALQITNLETRMTAHIKYREITWWVWFLIAALLIWGLTGAFWARQAALFIAVLQAVTFIANNCRHFPTQVRAAYALWMAASFVPELTFMYWIQTAGTTTLVLAGYCPLARMLLLAPWNRSAPLTWQRLGVIIFHPPITGSVLTGLPL